MAVTQTRTILITGGAGFIGGCFVRQMLEEVQVRVVNLDKLTYAGNLDSLAAVTDNSSHVFVRGDIGDRALVEKLLRQYRPRWIVHFAAESHVDRSIDAPGAFVQTNVAGTVELLMAALEYWRSLVLKQAKADRDFALRPAGPYKRTIAG